MAGAKKKKHGKLESSGIGAHGQAIAVAGRPTHAGTLETPRWSGEGRGQAKTFRQSRPAGEKGAEIHNGAPEKDEEWNESERIFVDEILHDVRL